MILNELRDLCTSEINALCLKAYRIGLQEGVEEGKKAVDRYDDGYVQGAEDLRKALINNLFKEEYYSSCETVEEILEQDTAKGIIDDFKEFDECLPGKVEHCKEFLHKALKPFEAKYGKEVVREALCEWGEADD